jgi:hypothetical protein
MDTVLPTSATEIFTETNNIAPTPFPQVKTWANVLLNDSVSIAWVMFRILDNNEIVVVLK